VGGAAHAHEGGCARSTAAHQRAERRERIGQVEIGRRMRGASGKLVFDGPRHSYFGGPPVIADFSARNTAPDRIGIIGPRLRQTT